MNPNDKRIDHLLGAFGAGALVNAWIDALITDDHLDPAAATRVACDRVADLSPWLIAAPGQTWRLREEFEPNADFSPHLVLVLGVRHAHGTHPRDGTSAILIADAEDDPRHAVGWMDVDDFAVCYSLEEWPAPEVRRVDDSDATTTPTPN
ncbi:hypothetical protein [Embleya sp. MST-111070]|uniref:hypothetical protein n=1 Tax=Embleya sp. MST-111070 TaxID=3398231 RepID=UPI003F73B9D5